MKIFTIYHNPKCSKSREALEILRSHSIQPVIVEYLKTPLDLKTLKQLRANFELKDFVRHNESVFKELHLNLDNESQILEAMLKEPILMQRPLVTYDDRAIIARPPEKILAFIKDIHKAW